MNNKITRHERRKDKEEKDLYIDKKGKQMIDKNNDR